MNEITEQEQTEKVTLKITKEAAGHLYETGAWGKFLGTLGFISVGLIILAGVFMGSSLSSLGSNFPVPGFIFTIVYFLFGALLFFPIYFLYEFSTSIRSSLVSKNSIDIEYAFKKLKSHYKFMGIYSIVIISLYVVAIVISLISAF